MTDYQITYGPLITLFRGTYDMVRAYQDLIALRADPDEIRVVAATIDGWEDVDMTDLLAGLRRLFATTDDEVTA